jgi:hypothetical protein
LCAAEDPIPNAQEARCASGLVCTALKILLPLEFDLWTTQPVVSHYTDYANALQTTECGITNSVEDVLLNEHGKNSYLFEATGYI